MTTRSLQVAALGWHHLSFGGGGGGCCYSWVSTYMFPLSSTLVPTVVLFIWLCCEEVAGSPELLHTHRTLRADGCFQPAQKGHCLPCYFHFKQQDPTGLQSDYRPSVGTWPWDSRRSPDGRGGPRLRGVNTPSCISVNIMIVVVFCCCHLLVFHHRDKVDSLFLGLYVTIFRVPIFAKYHIVFLPLWAANSGPANYI